MSLVGHTFCITGRLSVLRGDFERLIRKHGGEIAVSVNKSVTHLVCADSTTNKAAAARNRGVEIVNERWVRERVGEISNKRSYSTYNNDVQEDDEEEENNDDNDSEDDVVPNYRRTIPIIPVPIADQDDSDSDDDIVPNYHRRTTPIVPAVPNSSIRRNEELNCEFFNVSCPTSESSPSDDLPIPSGARLNIHARRIPNLFELDEDCQFFIRLAYQDLTGISRPRGSAYRPFVIFIPTQSSVLEQVMVDALDISERRELKESLSTITGKIRTSLRILFGSDVGEQSEDPNIMSNRQRIRRCMEQCKERYEYLGDSVFSAEIRSTSCDLNFFGIRKTVESWPKSHDMVIGLVNSVLK